MKHNVLYLILLLTLNLLTSCSQEDDIDEIFVGKTWFMNGATINGLKLNNEITNFYTDAGTSAYYITFSQSTFQGALSEGVTFSGTWSADGKKQSITLRFTNQPSVSSEFDRQISQILTSITSYSSGAEFLTLKKDSHNEVMFGNAR